MPRRSMVLTLSGLIVSLLLNACSSETTQSRSTIAAGQGSIPAEESAHERMQRIINGMR